MHSWTKGLSLRKTPSSPSVADTIRPSSIGLRISLNATEPVPYLGSFVSKSLSGIVRIIRASDVVLWNSPSVIYPVKRIGFSLVALRKCPQTVAFGKGSSVIGPVQLELQSMVVIIHVLVISKMVETSSHREHTASVSYMGHVQLLEGHDKGMSGRVPLPNGTGWVPFP